MAEWFQITNSKSESFCLRCWIDEVTERATQEKDSLKCWNTIHWHCQRYMSACFDTVNIIMKSRMRESRTYGSVRGLHCEVWVYSTFARSQNSFYKKTSNKKDRQKELLEEYLEKRAQVKKQQQEMLNEKIAKQEQERSRLLRSWNNERLLSKASNAYEANAMTEAVTDSAFSLG